MNDPEAPVPSSVKDPEPWQEEDVQLPAWPRDADLVELKLDAPDDRFRHYIDLRSLSTGRDGVVRYTLVTESDSGARNINFEGLRCTPKGRYKVYAYGANQQFMPTTVGEDWQLIDERATDTSRYELWRHYLCVPRLFKPRDRKQQVRLLRNGRVPQVENTGFLTN
ncbi:hypothetical protein F2Q65_17520 [Thiohalocapsa marina]|uniref:CNP1-like uncharacterized domain-containing protein n=1 Tax=Thiohalocapsa marina TaxID=424902 RepID=A0A5M8FFK9_9GAMM|nr:hypothetical protein F2Q65_17520 [Thiohalocapsa marina]